MKTETTQLRKPGTTRRAFLKGSASAVSAATLAGLDPGRFARAAGSDVLRVGMIGCGGRNTGAAVQALSADPGARLFAMCDMLMDRVKTAREGIRAKKPEQTDVADERCFAGLDAYRKVIDLCDVVLIANAAKFHPLHTMAAVAAGRHVFVEKPCAIDPAGIQLMRKACALAAQKKLSVASGLQSRHHPGYVETVRRIHEGAIGDVLALEENFLRAPYVVRERDPGLSEIQWQCGTQYHFNWLSGDDVPQSLVHNLDRANWVLRDATPLKCHGMAGRSSMTEPIYGNVFDHHSVVYEFPGEVRVYAFCRTTTGCYNQTSSLVIGSKGRASLLRCEITGENPWRWEGKADPYQIEHDKLFAAIRSGSPVNDGDYMTRSTLIGIMGQISCYTGEEITWERISASGFGFPPRPEDCHDDMEPPVKPGPDGSYPVYVPGRTRLLEELPKAPAKKT